MGARVLPDVGIYTHLGTPTLFIVNRQALPKSEVKTPKLQKGPTL